MYYCEYVTTHSPPPPKKERTTLFRKWEVYRELKSSLQCCASRLGKLAWSYVRLCYWFFKFSSMFCNVLSWLVWRSSIVSSFLKIIQDLWNWLRVPLLCQVFLLAWFFACLFCLILFFLLSLFFQIIIFSLIIQINWF